MNGFHAPPTKDFTSCAKLMGAQSGHFQQLVDWASQKCAVADDLNGLVVLPIQHLVPRIAMPVAERLALCQVGMTTMAGKIRETGRDYATVDDANSHSFADIYGQPLPGFPDIGEVPGLQHLGDFTDESITWKEPDPAGDDTAKNIAHLLKIVTHLPDSAIPGMSGASAKALGLPSNIGNIGGVVLGVGEKLFKLITGRSLIAILLDPIFGNYGRLKYLQEAYDQLGEGSYTVAGTMRKGAVRLGGEWTGDAATGFDSLMFRWSMGAGGIGDAAKILSTVFRDAYYTIAALVLAALTEIAHLINYELKQLVEQVIADIGIEVVGGGPEDPVADVAAILYDLYKDYKMVSRVITAVQVIVTIIEKIPPAVQKVEQEVNELIALFKAPLDIPAAINSLIDHVKQHGFEFEKNSGWDPKLGVARIALLPG